MKFYNLMAQVIAMYPKETLFSEGSSCRIPELKAFWSTFKNGKDMVQFSRNEFVLALLFMERFDE